MILNNLPSALLTILYDYLTPYDLIRLVLVLSKNTLPFLKGPETQRKFLEHLVQKWCVSQQATEKSKVEVALLSMVGGVQDLARLLVVAQPLPQGLFSNENDLDIHNDMACFRGPVGTANRSVQSLVPFPPIPGKMAVTLLSAVKELSAWSILMIDRFVTTVRASVPRAVVPCVVPMNVSIYTRLSSSQLPTALINFAMKRGSIDAISVPSSSSSSPLIRRKRSVSLPTFGSR